MSSMVDVIFPRINSEQEQDHFITILTPIPSQTSEFGENAIADNGNETPIQADHLDRSNSKDSISYPVDTGGFGMVYVAEHIFLSRPVTIKIINTDRSNLIPDNDISFLDEFDKVESLLRLSPNSLS